MRLPSWVLAVAVVFFACNASARGGLIVNGDFSSTTGFQSDYHNGTATEDSLFLGGGPSNQGAGWYALIGKQYANHNASDAGNFATVQHPIGFPSYMAVNGSTDNSLSFWSEQVTLIAGDSYEFSFLATSLVSVSGFPRANLVLSLPDGSQPTFRMPTFYDSTQNDKGWTTYTAPFTVPSSGSFTISMRDNNASAEANDFGITAISLTDISAAPAPSSFTMLGIALITFAGYYGWRRWRQFATA